MATTPFDVIVCGSLHLDIMVHAPHLPRIDETAVGTAWETVCGGKGGNQAVMAARMGARTAMIGRTGSDDFGRQLRANLEANGVDGSEVRVAHGAGSGMSVAVLKPDGDYGAVIVSGANLSLEAANCSDGLAHLGPAKMLVLQNEIPASANAGIAARAAAAGMHVILNAAPARPLDPALYDNVGTLVVNRVEAAMVSGLPVSDQSSALAALSALGGGRRNVVLTLGGDGLVMQPYNGEATVLAAHPVVPVSTHGAGDCFIGALASRLAKGDRLEHAAAFANLAAARYVALPGAQRQSFGLDTMKPASL